MLRFYSPVETIGGGVVLDGCPKKHRKNDKKAYETFKIKEHGTESERVELAYLEHQGKFFTLKELMKKCSFDRNQARNLVKKLAEARVLVQLFDEVYIHQDEMKLYEKRVVKFMDVFHKEFPLKEGMGIEEARNKLQLGSNTKVIDAILEGLKANKIIKEDKGLISNYRFKVVVKEDEDALLREITEAYLAFGFAPLATDLYMKEHSKQKKFKPVFTSLLNKKVLIRLDDQYCLHKDFYEKAKETVRKIAAEKSVVELGEFRESIGCSRRVAVPILEHFDKTGFTVKTSEGRILK